MIDSAAERTKRAITGNIFIILSRIRRSHRLNVVQSLGDVGRRSSGQRGQVRHAEPAHQPGRQRDREIVVDD
ncbi:hypothetical protein, partial [Natronoarchaeum mannanilyticum]|uniref:hypothetical protein n=1 Tax=Natronoarchaeum mannanilyticum TaxID=926360 RepID=UPI0031DBC2FF